MTEIFIGVGRALTQWERFERVLASIFALFVSGGRHSLPALRAYGSIVTFRGRADMLDAASEAFFSIHPNEELQKRVDELVELARHYSPRRNEIAHGIVGAMRRPARGSALFPADYATNKYKLPPAPYDPNSREIPVYIYTKFELATFIARFRELWSLAHDVWEPLSEFRRAKYPRQPKP